MNAITKFISNSLVLYVLLALTTHVTPVRANGITDYLKSGYPVISIVGGTFLIAVVYYISYRSRKQTGGILNDQIWRENALFTVFLIFIYCCGIFLIFGPDRLADVTDNPRSAIIGLQLLFQVALGLYLMYHPSPMITDLYIVFGLFNLLALFGSNWLFNYNYAIWTLTKENCNRYFSGSDTTVGSFTRCHDDGYLQFLRVMGHLVSLVLLTSIIYAISSAYEAGHRIFSYGNSNTATGAPATAAPTTTSTYPSTAYPNTSYPTKEVAAPTTVGPATSVPVNY